MNSYAAPVVWFIIIVYTVRRCARDRAERDPAGSSSTSMWSSCWTLLFRCCACSWCGCALAVALAYAYRESRDAIGARSAIDVRSARVV